MIHSLPVYNRNGVKLDIDFNNLKINLSGKKYTINITTSVYQ